MRRMRLVALALLVAGAVALGASAATTAPPDYAALALNVLPPGEGMTTFQQVVTFRSHP